MQPALMHCRIVKKRGKALAERDVEFKSEREAETLLRDKKQTTIEAPSTLRNDLSPIQYARVMKESQFSDEHESESVPTYFKSDVESGLSNTILEDGDDLDKEAKTTVTSGVFSPDLFRSSCHRILANSFSSPMGPPGKKYSTRSVST